MIINQSRHYVLTIAMLSSSAFAQLIDQTRAPNLEGEGIKKSYLDRIGVGSGDWSTPIRRPSSFRAIRSGPSGGGASFSIANSPKPKDWDRAWAPGSPIAAPVAMAYRGVPPALAVPWPSPPPAAALSLPPAWFSGPLWARWPQYDAERHLTPWGRGAIGQGHLHRPWSARSSGLTRVLEFAHPDSSG